MRTPPIHILFIALVFLCLPLGGRAQVHTEFKAKNFAPDKRTEFTKALNAFREGERQYKLLVKEGNMDNVPAILNLFRTAYAFNPNHIALNRYLVTLLLMQQRHRELFPHLEKLYDLKADLSADEQFMLASLLQAKGSFVRAELVFKRFLQTHGTNDFWAEGRLQNAEKRIAECQTGAEVSAQAVHFSTGKEFIQPPADDTKQLFYNHRYGWWALYDDGAPERLSAGVRKPLTQKTGGRLYSDLNALLFITCNDSVLKQESGMPKLELDKLNGAFRNKTPFISPDLRLLYFSSDRPGGFGGFDIWLARFNSDGTLRSVTNAGAGVNDAYDQFAPSLSADGTRFFVASNGQGTTGGSDILYGTLRGDSVERLSNLGFPVNSGYDEQEIIWDITGTKGYLKRAVYDSVAYLPFHETGSAREALFIGSGFSSANVGTLSSVKYESGGRESFINGICKLSIRQQKPDDVRTEIEIFNLADGSTFLRETLPDTATALNYLLPSQYAYGIHITGEGLVPFTAHLDLRPDDVFYERNLTAVLKPIKKGTPFVLSNIFFSKDYNDMDPRSRYEISRMAAWLKENPKVKVEVAVHTDSLSMHSVVIAAGESAAFQVYELLKHEYGIEKRRLDWMFYGPDKPLYMGKDMRETSQNRRIELIITDK